VTLEELIVSNLAMSDATVKLLMEKGVFTDTEFKAKLDTERANYLAVLKRLPLKVMCGRFTASLSSAR
jgi:hypothetical protein